jgi:RNA polymerase sigma-70 factor (ECF subfamily)
MTSEVKKPPETLDSYRPLLFSIAYQMTSSASEAEDLVQETYLRYQQAQSQVEIESLKSFLTTILVHLAIDYLKSSRTSASAMSGCGCRSRCSPPTPNPCRARWWSVGRPC